MNFNYDNPFQDPYMNGMAQGPYGQPATDYIAGQFAPQQYGQPYSPPPAPPYGSPYQPPHDPYSNQPYQPAPDPFGAPPYQPQQGERYPQPPYGAPYQAPQDPFALPQYQPPQPQYQPPQPQYQPPQPQYQPPQPQAEPQWPQRQEPQPQYQPQQPQYQPAQPQAEPQWPQRQEPQPKPAERAPEKEQPQPPQEKPSAVQGVNSRPEQNDHSINDKLDDDFLNSVLNEISRTKAGETEQVLKANADFLDSVLDFTATTPATENTEREVAAGAEPPVREEAELFVPEAAHKEAAAAPEPKNEPSKPESTLQPDMRIIEEEPKPEYKHAAEPELEQSAAPQPVEIPAELPQKENKPEEEPDTKKAAAPEPAVTQAEEPEEDVKEYIPRKNEIPVEEPESAAPEDIIETLPEEPQLSEPAAEPEPEPKANERELVRAAAEQHADIVEDESGIAIKSLSEQMRMQLNEHSIPPQEILPEEDSVFGLDTNELIKRAYAIGTEELVRDSLDTSKQSDEQDDPHFAAKEYLRAKERQAAELRMPEAENKSEGLSEPDIAQDAPIAAPVGDTQVETVEKPSENCLFNAETELDEYGDWFVCRNEAPQSAESAVVAVNISCNLFYEGGSSEKSRVVSNASFKVLRGSVCGFAADRAYDSFTLLSVIAGCRHFDSGSLSILDNSVAAKELVEMPNMLYIDGTDVLDQEMTVGETLALALAYSPESDIDKVIDECGFTELLDMKVRKLSMAQKVALYMMSACASKIVEIVAINIPELSFRGADNRYLFSVINILRRNGKTVLISSVSSDYVDEVADSVVYMMGGKVVYNGPVSDFCCAASKIILAAKCADSAKVATAVNQLVPELFVKTGDDGFIVSNSRTMFNSAKFEEMMKRQSVQYGEVVARPLCFLAAAREVFNK